MRAGFIALLLVIASGLAYSQKNSNQDDDFVTDPALRAYLDRTPFQHGSLHGYEDGYQAGDTDFHLQRPTPDLTKVKEFRLATRGYVDGDKDEYRAGYQDGYRLGYEDALVGRPFVAVEHLQAAAENKPVTVAQSNPTSTDDEGASVEVATVALPSMPIKVPMNAIFPARQSVRPPGPSARDSALAKIMNNLRRTFMPSMITPQALVPASPR